MYAPLQFFIVDKKDVINCTAYSNNELRISVAKNDTLLKQTILRLLADLEPILLDRSRGGNQPIYRPAVDL